MAKSYTNALNVDPLQPLINMITQLATPMVTLIGGGGKTSLMYWLAAGLKSCGRTVVATTTTKLYRPDPKISSLVLAATFSDCLQALEQVRSSRQIITLARRAWEKDPCKVTGFGRETIDELARGASDVIFIVEGDGAAGKSLKGHNQYEPNIPSTTTLLIPVIGIDVIGRNLNDIYVHRARRVSELTGVGYNSIVTPDLVIQLLFHSPGYLRACPAGAVILPFVNKVETENAWIQARTLALALVASKQNNISQVMLGSLRQSRLTFI